MKKLTSGTTDLTTGRPLTRLKLYKGAEHNNAAQKPEAWTLD